tara:strand:+ start:12369 stop:12791 length:423 start_codon:yes stop_codon:yes gene_type:complete
MKTISKYLTLLLLLAVASSANLAAQATAVMRVEVTIISGASLTQASDIELPLSISSNSASTNQEMFQITTSKNTALDFDCPESVLVTNEFGESVTIYTNSSVTENKETGSRYFALESNATPTHNTRGKYSGTLTTTIDYL